MKQTACQPLAEVANKPVVQVAVGVLQQADGRILLAERPAGKVSGGYWEFPGGKFEIAETPLQALQREVYEEVGLVLQQASPWLTYEYHYPDKRVRLHFYRVSAWQGTPHGREGQRIAWEDPQHLTVGPLLPANQRALRALRLPPVYAITQAGKYGVGPFMLRLEAALQRGLRLIQVREPQLSPGQQAQFARRVIALAHFYGARVLVNGDESLARKVGADGVHLSVQRLQRQTTRPDLGLWAASCHTAEDVARAIDLDVDWIVISQVLATASHPGVSGMGWQKFAELVHNLPVPSYALGGMRLDLLDTARQHGAQGVALFSGIW